MKGAPLGSLVAVPLSGAHITHVPLLAGHDTKPNLDGEESRPEEGGTVEGEATGKAP
jgi:hypothetical protein